MTKAVQIHAFGGPEVLRVDDIVLPPPAPGEVRIRVGAIGLNRIEAIFRAGGFGSSDLPSRIGYEAAGTIEAVGSAVTDFAIGDRVAALPGLSMAHYGTYGEAILYRADMLVRVPDDQPFDAAAATWMQYLTAYALVDVARIAAGEAVVITAASSSVGLAAIQIANATGAIPIAVTRGRTKTAALRAHGAAHVLVSSAEDVAQAVMAITGGRGARIAFDAVAGPALASLLPAIAPAGTVILYGSLGGDMTSFAAPLMMLHGITLRGFAMSEILADPVRRRAAIAYVHAGLADGALCPVIDRTFDLDDIVAAHRYLEGNDQIGKVVVTVQ